MKIKLTNLLRPALLGMAFIAAAASAQVRPLDRVAVIVDNDIIMQSELEQRLVEVQRNIRTRGAEQLPMDVLQQQVLDRLILESIQLQIGERYGIRISDEELNNAMAGIAQRNGLNLSQFQAALARDGLSYDQARKQVRNEMIVGRVRQYQVAERIDISEQEVRNFLASDLGKMHLSEEYHLANILIPVPEGASSSQIQEAERITKDTYNQLRSGADFGRMAMARSASETALDGGDIGWRSSAQMPPPFDSMLADLPIGGVTSPVRTPGGFIIFKLLGKRGGETVLRDEVHVRHILIKPSEIRSPLEAQRLAERLYERIQAGEDFATLAKSYSEDPGSALNGGDLNWIPPESLVPEFRETMANTATGQMSRPFQSQFGWHILEVLGRRATDSSDQVREQQALNILRNRRYDEELQSWLRQIRDEAYVEIKI